MAQATNTTEGEIVLAGDFTGDAFNPELRASGVIPGVYPIVTTLAVDSKGRITSAGALSSDKILEVIPTATSSVKGLFSIGTGLSVNAGAVSILIDTNNNPASATNLGFTRVESIAISNLSLVAGTLSIPDATDTQKGVFTVGADLTSSNGVVSVAYNFSSIDSQLPLASSTTAGKITVAAPFVINSGVVSIPDATSTTKGVVSISNGIAVSSGNITLDNVPRTNFANTYAAAQLASSVSVNSNDVAGNTLAPFDYAQQTIFVNMVSNLTINIGTSLPSSGQFQSKTIVLNYTAGSPITVSLNPSIRTNTALVFSNGTTTTSDLLTLYAVGSTVYAVLTPNFV